MSELEEWEMHRRRYINLGRARKLQKTLEEAGYLEDFPHHLSSEARFEIPIPAVLFHLIVDSLLLAEKEGKVISLASLQDLVASAHSVFEKEPRFEKEPWKS